MPERRGFRFALEVLFLAGLAAALSFADLRPIVIAGLMLLGWFLVALLEWVSWRGEAHYGRGLPPRYYVPRASLPEPVPVEQEWYGYPEPERHDDAPTWIASPAIQAELVGAWPLARVSVEKAELASEFDPMELLAPRPETSEEEPAQEQISSAPAAVRFERHRIDPLRDPERSRLPWRRGGDEDAGVATMAARPEGLRLLPLLLKRED
jgi:hypothetical protein